jgi:hypothetical protein
MRAYHLQSKAGSESLVRADLGPVDISWHPEFDRGQSQEAEV